ncbi:hypothetical protein OESDEN_06932 [Oesophagostomum dentatum]|uniref:Aminopeptidase N-like N-terminal domain-containing protein n=1 Tax=Oesophagostomum dentatum TaxID=61180 RepID=A0A0B1T7H1_OESDE|nr:hypothetical protein OESDEN_06932 [Oesophagostomum dentatum]
MFADRRPARGKGVDCPALPGTLQTTQSDESLLSEECLSDLFPDGFEPTLNSTWIHRDTVEFIFAQKLPPGEFLLTVGEYNGRLSNASTGVIQRNLTLFTTHLQPNFARELLPCVDHPSVKAAFRLTIIHPTNTVAESNTIANDVHVVDPQWQKTVFAPTPLLPAYLIAFSIMPEAYKQNKYSQQAKPALEYEGRGGTQL